MRTLAISSVKRASLPSLAAARPAVGTRVRHADIHIADPLSGSPSEQREIPAARPNKRVQVQLLAKDAWPRVRAIINHAAATAGFDAPIVRNGVPKGLDFHLEQIENNFTAGKGVNYRKKRELLEERKGNWYIPDIGPESPLQP